jgi:nicotinamidase-related amidase
MQLPLNAALVVIDVQQGFNDARWAARNNPEAESRVAALLGAWRAAGQPLFHVRHASTSPNGSFRPD